MPVENVDRWQPGLDDKTAVNVVRRVAEAGEGEGDTQLAAKAEVPHPLLNIEHMGKLEGSDLEFVQRMFQAIVAQRQMLLESNARRDKSQSHGLHDLVVEAELIMLETEGRCLKAALEADLYLVDKHMGVRQVDGANVMNMGCRKGGEDCVITVVMPHERFPELEATHDYYHEMLAKHCRATARQFNSLPHDERLRIIERHDAHRKTPSPDHADQEWYARQFPVGVTLDRQRAMLEAK